MAIGDNNRKFILIYLISLNLKKTMEWKDKHGENSENSCIVPHPLISYGNKYRSITKVRKI